MKWTLVWETDVGGDYYAGRDSALYRDGELVWNGYSCDAAEDIVGAIVDDVEVLVGATLPVDQWSKHGQWAARLADVKLTSS